MESKSEKKALIAALVISLVTLAVVTAILIYTLVKQNHPQELPQSSSSLGQTIGAEGSTVSSDQPGNSGSSASDALFKEITKDTVRDQTENLTLYGETTFDLDPDDNEVEILEIYVDAQQDESGEFMWNDGQRWVVTVRRGDEMFVLFDQYVQIGQVDAHPFYDMDTQKPHVLLLVQQGAALDALEFSYDSQKDVFLEKEIYHRSNINLLH